MDRIRFKTAVGWCEVAWEGNCIQGLKLDVPPSTQKISAPAWVQTVIHRIQQHWEGVPQDFSDVPLALDTTPPFFKRVYHALQKIPSGQVLTYADLAKRARSPKAVRAVGQAMARNPFPILIPCHRVIAATALGGFSGGKGVSTKRRLLKAEGSAPDLVLTSKNG